MKNIKLILAIQLLSLTSCFAQILPVEQKYRYINSEEGLEGAGITYVKDINGVFEKFIGTWKGSLDSKNYEIRIMKALENSFGIQEDFLVIKYLIRNNDNIIESTINDADNSPYVVLGHYISENGTYIFNFGGGKTDCGLDGYLFVEALPNSNLKVFLSPKGEYQYTCPSQTPFIVFPEEYVIYTRQ